jgi:hypothetical protein
MEPCPARATTLLILLNKIDDLELFCFEAAATRVVVWNGFAQDPQSSVIRISIAGHCEPARGLTGTAISVINQSLVGDLLETHISTCLALR